MERETLAWARKGIEAEIQQVTRQLDDLKQKLSSLSTDATAGPVRHHHKRGPMSAETRQKLKQAQLRRWEARRAMENKGKKKD